MMRVVVPSLELMAGNVGEGTRQGKAVSRHDSNIDRWLFRARRPKILAQSQVLLSALLSAWPRQFKWLRACAFIFGGAQGRNAILRFKEIIPNPKQACMQIIDIEN